MTAPSGVLRTLLAEDAVLEQLADGRWHLRVPGRPYERVAARVVAGLERDGHLTDAERRPFVLRALRLSDAGREAAEAGGAP